MKVETRIKTMLTLTSSALILFVVTVVVEHFVPSVICTALWHPISCSTFQAYGIYAAPALPTLIAFALLVAIVPIGVLGVVSETTIRHISAQTPNKLLAKTGATTNRSPHPNPRFRACEARLEGVDIHPHNESSNRSVRHATMK